MRPRLEITMNREGIVGYLRDLNHKSESVTWRTGSSEEADGIQVGGFPVHQ